MFFLTQGEAYILFTIFLVFLLASRFNIDWFKNVDSREHLDVKDLVRGSIFAEVSEMEDAYEHFATTPGVEIVEIKTL